MGPLVLALLVAAAPAEGSVRVKVEREGLRYTGDCGAWFFDDDAGPDDAPRLRHDDLAAPASLPRGAYQVQVRCPSSEGLFVRTLPLRLAKQRQTLRAKMRPGFALVRVVRDGVEVPADLVFYDGFGRVVLEGRDKIAHPLPPGALHVVARVRKDVDAAATGRKQLRAARQLKVRRGRKTTLKLDVSDGQLALKILHNDEPAEGSGALYLPGTRREVARDAAGEPASAPPGVYDLATRLDVSHDFSEKRQRGIRIRPGKTTRASANHATGDLMVKLVRGGLPLVAGEAAKVELIRGGEPFNALAVGETAILAPGAYRVRATLEGRQDAVGSVSDEKRVRVVARRAQAVTLDLSSSPVVVKTFVGGAPERLLVELRRDGRTVLRRKTSRKGELRAPLSPGWYGVRAVLEAEQGPIAEQREVRVKRGQPAEVVVDLALGRAIVQVFEEGVAVPAEVAFVPEGRQEPALRAAGGMEVFLTPGRYALTVGRGRFERTFSAITVAPGKLVERQLELIDAAGRTPAAAAEEKRRKLRLKGD